MQHPSHTFGGHDRGILIIDQEAKRIAPFSRNILYSVLPAAFKTKEFKVPTFNNAMQPTNFNVGTKAQWKWLEVRNYSKS